MTRKSFRALRIRFLSILALRIPVIEKGTLNEDVVAVCSRASEQKDQDPAEPFVVF